MYQNSRIGDSTYEMPSFVKHTVNNNDFILHCNRTIFWEQEKILILSDLHLGKTGHFRKHGIAIPATVMKEDMQRFVAAIQFYKPSLVVIVGDLFHSVANKEHELFLKWRNDLLHVPMLLVKGNHDIVPATWYKNAGIEVVEKIWRRNNFYLCIILRMPKKKQLLKRIIFSAATFTRR